MTLHPMVESADALVDVRRYDEAAALLGRRLAEEPDDVRAWTKLARCRLAAKDPEQALDAIGEALRRAPEDINALYMHAQVLRRANHLDLAERWQRAEASLRAALRVDPQNSAVHASLAQFVLFYPNRRAEALELAREAVRLDPEEVRAYQALWMTAAGASDTETYNWALRQVLRLEPTNGQALMLVSGQEAGQPGVTAGRAAEIFADALAVHPDSPGLRQDLDRATYRLLRGVRWLALLCLAAAGAMIDLFPSQGEEIRELPVPLGNRLWVLTIMAAIWGFGAWRRYRRLRAGVRLSVRSLVRRGRWARIVLAQAAWTQLCALLITLPPWTARTVPQVLFWAGLLVPLSTLWFDRRKRG
ncbi:tetratricopeptide repeat protein [Micromonospora sp. CPCC 205371]|nr:tetratricopeptide repeat protein [Micromonospora sp. CPCC 205371]